jgi:nicotinamidase-related amidase
VAAQTLVGQSSLASRSTEYLEFVEHWLESRPALNLAELISTSEGPEHIAVVSVDLIVGFCHRGPLSSPRVASILPAVSTLFERAHAAGIRNIILTQDTHRPDAEEFASYPAHCVAGTEESRTAPELARLPMADTFTIAEKNSISSVIAPVYLAWEQENGPFTTYIVVGDCTDLCVYQAAMALKVRSQAWHLGQRVIVPLNCVDTYDLPVATAQSIRAQPHPGDLLHHVFLHSMAQNGVEVVAEIQ